MPFIQKEPFTFLNIKLTDHGRLAAASGNLVFDKIVVSDREIDYSLTRDGLYNLFNNRVLDVVDFYPDIDLKNYDGSIYFKKNQFNVTTEQILITASTSSSTISSVILGNKGLNYTDNVLNFGTTNATFNAGGYNPSVGELVFIPWTSSDAPSSYLFNSLPSGICFNVGVYRITESIDTENFVLDRPIPNYYLGSNPGMQCQFFYNNVIEDYSGNTTSIDPRIWNMNIVRTNTVIGSNSIGSSTVSGYTTYGSLEYNGTKHYFGFDDNTPIVGFIHYTNKFSGNTYGEQFIEKTFELNFSIIMWHHGYNAYYNNNTSLQFNSYNSSGDTLGLFLSDAYGSTYYDSLTKTTYRELRDGRDGGSMVVGRVYHKLKLVIITDQELLTALTYKNNRNYTYPDFNLSLTSVPKYPLYPSGSTFGATATGLVEDGYDYFVTYIPEWSGYTANYSYGNAPSVPCAYVKKITGELDANRREQYIKISFPNPNSFPFMRDDDGLNSYSTGWNANTVQILVNKQPSSANYNIGNVPFQDWRRISDKTIGGNGVYRASDVGDNTIDPRKLNSFEFIISKEDYESGSTYSINTGITLNQNWLNFGDEAFLYGTVKTGIGATIFKSSIQVFLDDSFLNKSNNTTYDPNTNAGTYITEVAILDASNKVVAAGKPTYPILKNNIRWLTLKLDIDF